ncbi:MAG TPA: alkaline phosphatase family protein [Kofleriaceae bacterium]|nr:alkaline phosphatase family protein [Kofleriaceae bacterium]
MALPEPTSLGRIVVALGVIVAAAATAIAIAVSCATIDLELARPPLASIRPVIASSPTPRLARRVFLIIIDGLRDASSHELPELERLRGLGTSATASSHYPTWSRPNYVSILSGVPPVASGVRTNRHRTPVALDSLMDRARDAGLEVALATDYEVLPRLFLRRRGAPRDAMPAVLDVDIGGNAEIFEREAQAPAADYESAFDDARYAPWPGGFVDAGTAAARSSADLVVMLVGTVDSAGHDHGGASAEYAAAARDADRALAEIAERIDLDRDAIIVTADHGHTDRGGHGGTAPEVIQVPLVMAGAGIRRGAALEHPRLIDVAPTVAALLGIAAPGHGLGRTLVDGLELDRDARDRRIAADRARLAVTEAAVATAAAGSIADRDRARARRGTGAVAAALLAIAIAVVLVRRRVVKLAPPRLVLAIAASVAIELALVVALAGWGGPLMASRGEATSALIRYGLLAFASLHLMSAVGLRGLRDGARLSSAIATSSITLGAALVPATAVWVAFPMRGACLPGPTWLATLPALELAAACTAAYVAIALAIELAWFAARRGARLDMHPFA